jgi:hypothetical protein
MCNGHGVQFRLNAKGQLGVGERWVAKSLQKRCLIIFRCVDANSSGAKLIFCPASSVSGPWSYDQESKLLTHRRGKR